MAWNVYLTVFKKRTTSQLRKLEPYYIGLCYGLPFIIAITFLIYKPANKPRIYGEATLWCWIAPDWQILRIAAFYGPVWVVLTITFMIYLLAGRIIFNLRRNLRKFVRDGSQSRSGEMSGNHTFTNSQHNQRIPEKAASSPPGSEDSIELAKVMSGNVVGAERGRHVPDLGAFTSYSCTVEVSAGAMGPGNGRSGVAKRAGRNTALEANTAAWAYCRCAMLFFLALVITWVSPPTHALPPQFPLTLYAAAVQYQPRAYAAETVRDGHVVQLCGGARAAVPGLLERIDLYRYDAAGVQEVL